MQFRRPNHSRKSGGHVQGALFLLCLVLMPGSAQATGAGHPGVIGNDDREPIDSAAPPWDAIGKIVIDGFSLRLSCTGVLVAPDIVVTAAHCLFNQRTGQYAKANRVAFIAGVRRDQHGEHSKARCVKLLDPSRDYRQPDADMDAVARDVAIITLAQPFSAAPIAIAGDANAGTIVTHVGYGADRPYLLSAHRDCKVTGAVGKAVTTDCDTTYGQSGGPLLVKDNDGWKIAAIMVRGIPEKANIAVPASVWGVLIADRSCGG